MASGYGKKSFGDKAKGALRRVFILSAMGGIFIGGPAYYQYGTVHEAEFKVKEVKETYKGYDEKKGAMYETRIITDKGLVLKNENSLLHAKFNSSDITGQLKEGREYNYYGYFNNDDGDKKDKAPKAEDKVWRIKYYGARIDIPFIHTQHNVLSVQEVTPEEIAARNKAAQEARRQNQQQQGQQQGQQQNQQGTVVQPGQTAPAGALSGTMITFETVVDGQKIQMTVPIEAANKITVNKVTPLVPQAAPKGPGG